MGITNHGTILTPRVVTYNRVIAEKQVEFPSSGNVNNDHQINC